MPAASGRARTCTRWHHLGMWYLILFTIVHLYMVIREDIIVAARPSSAR